MEAFNQILSITKPKGILAFTATTISPSTSSTATATATTSTTNSNNTATASDSELEERKRRYTEQLTGIQQQLEEEGKWRCIMESQEWKYVPKDDPNELYKLWIYQKC